MNDPRVGRKVRCKDNGWTGTIEYVGRDTEGEWFSIIQGDIARGGVEPENVEFIDDMRCILCGGPRNLSVDMELQDKCFDCYHKEQDNEAGQNNHSL